MRTGPAPLTTMKLTPRHYAFIVFALATLAFARSVSFSFVHLDDPLHLDGNPSLSPPDLKAIWTQPYASMYLPVTYTAWAVVAAFAGQNPDYHPNAFGYPVGFRYRAWAFHLASVLLHALNAALVFFLLFALAGNATAALGGALLYAWHPVQVEPVAWVSGFRDVLAASFSLAGLLLYGRYARAASSLKDRRLLGASALFLLAVLAKPTAVAVPLMAAALGWRVFGRKPAEAARECAVMLAAALPPVLFAAIAHPRENGAFVVPSLPLRPLVALDAIGFYLVKLVYPGRLAIDYGRSPEYLRQSGWLYASPLAAVAMLALYRAAKRAGDGIVSLSLDWFLLGILPVLGLVPFFQGNSTVSDRYLYLALVGPALAVARLLARNERLVPFFAALLLLFVARSFVQLGTWRDTASMAGNALDVNPRSWLAHDILAFSDLSDERLNDAVSHFEECARLRPQYATFKNIATIRMSQKRYADALKALEAALEQEPGVPEDFYNVGLCHMFTGDTPGAKDALLKAISLRPDFALAKKVLGRLEEKDAGNRAPASVPPKR